MRSTITLAAGALLGFSTLAAAQETTPALQLPVADCLCELALETGSTVATLEDVSGQVLLADGGGYTPVRSSVGLAPGDRIVLLSDGRAVLTDGATCGVALAPGSILDLDARDGRVCIAHASQAAMIEPAQAPPTGFTGGSDVQQEALLFMISMGVGFGVAALIATALDDDDRPVSP